MKKQLKASFPILSGFLGGKEQYAPPSVAVMVLFQEIIYPKARRRNDCSEAGQRKTFVCWRGEGMSAGSKASMEF